MFGKSLYGACQFYFSVSDNTITTPETGLRPFAGYPGSLIQQNYGESLDAHGFLIWDLRKNSVEAFDVPNDHTMHTIHVDAGVDYDDLDIKLNPSKYTHIKVMWVDYMSKLTRDNKAKIARHLRERYKPVELAFRQKAIKINDEGVMVDISAQALEDISTEHSQKKIFTEFLEANQFVADDIASILAIHENINERLRTSGLEEAQGVEYKIQSLWIDNFKSYGDKTVLDWDGKDGVWQITGENTAGKSTILDAITYLFYGTILGFQGSEREKLGDNRFINKNRDLDYCEVGAYLIINGAKHKLVRRTERVWQNSKGVRNIKTVSTSINFFEVIGTNRDAEEKLRDIGVDRKVQTDKLVQEYFGTMTDFMRTSFINADTLTNLLSINHAQFVDSLLRDIGLDIFEKLLKEFKAWREETYSRVSRIQLSMTEEVQRIADYQEAIVTGEAEVLVIQDRIAELETRIAKGQDYITKNLYPKMQSVRPELADADPEAIRADIHALLQRIDGMRDDMESEQAEIEAMVTTYDCETHEALLQRKEAHQERVSQLRQKIREQEVKKSDAQHEIAVIQGRINVRQRDFNQLAQWEKDTRANIEREISVVQREIELLESSKTCPTCKREKNEDVLAGIFESIREKNNEIQTNLMPRLNSVTVERGVQEALIALAISDINAERTPVLAVMDQCDLRITELKGDINKHILEGDEIGQSIAVMVTEKTVWERKQRREADLLLIPMKMENIKLQSDAKSRLLEDLEQAQGLLENNKLVQASIDKATEKIEELRDMWGEEVKNRALVEKGTIPRAKEEITQIQATLVRFEEQEKREFLLKAYERCIHRDGIPTMLLKQYLNVINIQLNNLLDGMKFVLFLNEDLQFKMYHENNETAIINVMQASGMEKTFSSLVLRLALRQVNNKFRNNILLMDEILGKLDANNLERFGDLLSRAKADIDKLVIIEHGYGDTINPDYIIHVTSDKKGVSTMVYDG